MIKRTQPTLHLEMSSGKKKYWIIERKKKLWFRDNRVNILIRKFTRTNSNNYETSK